MLTSVVELTDLIDERKSVVGVIGLGYVGLPLARAFVRSGFRALGFDSDAEKIRAILRGESYIAHIPAGDIQQMRANGFEPTGDFEKLSVPDVLLICVPTPLTAGREPDLSFVRSTAELISARLRRNQLVILESTSYPGTTRSVVLPILARSGLRIGEEIFLAYSPEREDPGREGHSVSEIPKVVAGFGPYDLELACALYRHVVPAVVRTESLEVAEASKILENTYRAVNIALVNEMKVVFDRMGIDIWQVISAAATKPFGFQSFYPGPGLGGPCLPVNPYYFAWAARETGFSTRLIEVASEVNVSMPAYVAGKVADALNLRGRSLNGSRILLVGLSYKKDVGDTRGSPGIELMNLLSTKGAWVEYSDPHISELPLMRRWVFPNASTQELTDDYVAQQDCLVIVTDHTVYQWERILKCARLVVDTRNATRPWHREFRSKIVLA